MKPFLAALVLAIVLIGPAPAPTLTTVNWNPGPVVTQTCQAQQFIAYTNTTSQAVRLVAMDLWQGLYRNAFADITIEVYRSDGMLLGRFAWDRYANPNADTERYLNFAPNAFDIAPGQSVQVNGLNCFVAGVPSPMAPTVVLYFLAE